MNGELFFVIYYGGIMIALGIFAQWILGREFKTCNQAEKEEK